MKRKKLELDKIRITLWDRLLITTVILLTMITLVFFHVYTENAQKNQISFVQISMEKMAQNQKSQFISFVNDKVQLLKALASYQEIYEMDLEKQRAFIKNHSVSLGFRHIFVMDTAGIGYYFEEDLSRDQRQEIFFSNVMNNDVFIAEPFYNEDGSAIMTVCVSINDNFQKVGALCGAINLSAIQQMIISNEMPLDGACFILDSNGNYVTRAGSTYLPENISLYDLKNSDVTLIQQSFEFQTDCSGIITLDDQQYLSQICYLPEYHWSIIQCIPMEEITKQFELMTILQQIILSAVAVLIFCIGRITYRWSKSDKETYTDALTHCNNRAACDKILNYLEKKTSDDITLMFMDLNKFKYVNDTFGHDKGDELLVIFSQALKDTFGNVGFVARLGGDEFVTILLNFSEEEILCYWKKLTDILDQQSKQLDFPYVISASYGYTTREKGDRTSLNALLQQADGKMYDQKHGAHIK